MHTIRSLPALFFATALGLMLFFQAPAPASGSLSASQDDPQGLIAGNTEKLLMELRDKGPEIKQNEQLAYDLSNELVVPYLDFPRITRLVIGKHWRSASKDQKQQLVEEIRKMLIRSYVTAMRTYADQIVANGQQIRYLPSSFKPGDRKATVRAVIMLQNGKTVDVQYMLYLNKDNWKIYDIRVGGISLAITYRTSFSEEIQRSGLDGLIARLSEQNRSGVVDFPGNTQKIIDDIAKP